jgi:hypothetical protein
MDRSSASRARRERYMRGSSVDQNLMMNIRYRRCSSWRTRRKHEVFSAIDEDECFSATETEYTNLDNVIVGIGDVLEQSEDVEDDEPATEIGLDKEGDYDRHISY